MKNENYDLKKIILNLVEVRAGNFIFALAGMLIFMVLKDSENEQLFFAFYIGTFMLYNLIRFFLLILMYQHVKNKESTFSVPYQTAMDALSNKIPEEMERIRKENESTNDGKV
jgi:hypothetical protein